MSDIPVHLLPFSVDQEGPINTKQYLKIEKENEHYETVIMGRKLIGNHIILPDTTIGHVYEKVKQDRYDDDEDIMEEEEAESVPWNRTKTTIDQFILWKKDLAPNKEDPRINTLQNWIEISKAIHEPIPLPSK